MFTLKWLRHGYLHAKFKPSVLCLPSKSISFWLKKKSILLQLALFQGTSRINYYAWVQERCMSVLACVCLTLNFSPKYLLGKFIFAAGHKAVEIMICTVQLTSCRRLKPCLRFLCILRKKESCKHSSPFPKWQTSCQNHLFIFSWKPKAFQ